MSYIAKQKLFYYKKYKIDIWGFLGNTLQVLNDNTVYKVYTTYKYKKLIRNRWRRTIKFYRKYYNMLNFLFKSRIKSKKLWKKNFGILQKCNKYWMRKMRRVKRRRFRFASKWILLDNIWNIFIKQTISKRLCNIFNILLEKRTTKIKIFFRRPFIYEPRAAMGSRRKQKKNEQFLSFRILKLFYIIYNYRQLKKIAYKAKLQDGVFEHNFISMIESKLPSYIYRISFFPTLFDSLDFVKGSNVWVNKKYRPFIYYNVKLFDIVGFRPLYKGYIAWSLFKRLRRKAFLFAFPTYTYISLTFFFIILIRRVQKIDIINTFDFDYYTITNYIK